MAERPGILNAGPYANWNPEKDPYLQRYATDQESKEKPFPWALAAPEMALTMGTGLLSMAPAGYAGMTVGGMNPEDRPLGIRMPNGKWYPSLIGNEPPTPADMVEHVMESKTFMPRSEVAQQGMQRMGENLTPLMEDFTKVGDWMVDKGVQAGLPASVIGAGMAGLLSAAETVPVGRAPAAAQTAARAAPRMDLDRLMSTARLAEKYDPNVTRASQALQSGAPIPAADPSLVTGLPEWLQSRPGLLASDEEIQALMDADIGSARRMRDVPANDPMFPSLLGNTQRGARQRGGPKQRGSTMVNGTNDLYFDSPITGNRQRLEVLKNPTDRQLARWGKANSDPFVRFAHDSNGDLYVWNGEDALHHQVMELIDPGWENKMPWDQMTRYTAEQPLASELLDNAMFKESQARTSGEIPEPTGTRNAAPGQNKPREDWTVEDWAEAGRWDGKVATSGDAMMNAPPISKAQERAYWDGVLEGAEQIGHIDTAVSARRQLNYLDQPIEGEVVPGGLLSGPGKNQHRTVDELRDAGAQIDDDGMVTLYHATDPESAKAIREQGRLKTDAEDQVYLSTRPDGEILGYGSDVVEVKVPADRLRMEDIFDGEAHVTVGGKDVPVEVVDTPAGRASTGNADVIPFRSPARFTVDPQKPFVRTGRIDGRDFELLEDGVDGKFSVFEVGADGVDEFVGRIDRPTEKAVRAAFDDMSPSQLAQHRGGPLDKQRGSVSDTGGGKEVLKTQATREAITAPAEFSQDTKNTIAYINQNRDIVGDDYLPLMSELEDRMYDLENPAEGKPTKQDLKEADWLRENIYRDLEKIGDRSIQEARDAYGLLGPVSGKRELEERMGEAWREPIKDVTPRQGLLASPLGDEPVWFRGSKHEPRVNPETGLLHLSSDEITAARFGPTTAYEIANGRYFDPDNVDDVAKLKEAFSGEEGLERYAKSLDEVHGGERTWVGGEQTMEDVREHFDYGVEAGLYQTMESPAITKWVKDNGYDGILLREDEYGPMGVALFDSSRVAKPGLPFAGPGGKQGGAVRDTGAGKKVLGNVAAREGILNITRTGSETPVSTGVGVREGLFDISGPGSGKHDKVTKMDAARTLEYLHRNTLGRQVADPTTRRGMNNMIARGADDVRFQLEQPVTGQGWYDEDIAKTFGLLEANFNPNYADPDIQTLWTGVAAPTSYGTPVPSNAAAATKIMDHYFDTGRIPLTNPETGKLWTMRDSSRQGLGITQSLVDRFGLEGYVDFMTSPQTLRDMAQLRMESGMYASGRSLPSYRPGGVSGKMDDTHLGAYILGPKGGPFFLNLNDINDTTVDLWQMRNYGRNQGQIRHPVSGEIIDAPISDAMRSHAKEYTRGVADRFGLSEQDTQAIQWYFEQQLYDQLGVSGAVPQAFSEGVESLMQKRGILQQ